MHGMFSMPGEAESKLYHMVVEIPMGSSAKLEVQKKVRHNPIMQV